MYSACDIASWFIYKTNAEIKENVADNDDFEVYEGITHLKLQKLLYYAQGVSLSMRNGQKLFDEKILAWEHGPVVKEVYDVYKNNGRNNLDIDFTDANNAIIASIENDAEVSNILNLVYDNFAIYTAWQLRDMTHEVGSPWDITVKTTGINSEILSNIIQKYFDDNIVDQNG